MAAIFNPPEMAPPAKSKNGFVCFLRNNNCNRNKMDLIISAAAARIAKGTTSFGIYEIEEDTLVLAASEPGNSQRPFSFDQREASVAFVLERHTEDWTLSIASQFG
jgi:hypothetical protein